jgi:hypothetical protein
VIWWRQTPDGARLAIRWLAAHDRWEVRHDSRPDWFESRQLALAIAAATGDPPDAIWIRDVVSDIGQSDERACSETSP